MSYIMSYIRVTFAEISMLDRRWKIPRFKPNLGKNHQTNHFYVVFQGGGVTAAESVF